MSESIIHPRIVPAANPPAPSSNRRRKNRKAKSKKSKKSQSKDVINAQTSANVFESTTHADLASEIADADQSSLGKFVSERYKAVTKKITRISSYGTMDPDRLNDDQKRALESLFVLEAVQKELTGVKEAVEAYVTDFKERLKMKDRETHENHTYGIALIQAQVTSNAIGLLNVLRLSAALKSGKMETPAIISDTEEGSAVLEVADALMGNLYTSDDRQNIINGFLFASSQWEGIPYTQIVETANTALKSLPVLPKANPFPNSPKLAATNLAFGEIPSPEHLNEESQHTLEFIDPASIVNVRA